MRNFGRLAVPDFNQRLAPKGGAAVLNPNPADTSLRDAVERGGYYNWVPDLPPEKRPELTAHFQQSGYNWNPTTSGIQGPVVPPGHRAGRDNIYGRGFPGV